MVDRRRTVFDPLVIRNFDVREKACVPITNKASRLRGPEMLGVTRFRLSCLALSLLRYSATVELSFTI